MKSLETRQRYLQTPAQLKSTTLRPTQAQGVRGLSDEGVKSPQVPSVKPDGFSRSGEADEAKSSRVSSILKGLGAFGNSDEDAGDESQVAKGGGGVSGKAIDGVSRAISNVLNKPSRDILDKADTVVEAQSTFEEMRNSPSHSPRDKKIQGDTIDVLSESLADSAIENPEAFAKALVETETALAEMRERQIEAGPPGGFLSLALSLGPDMQGRNDALNQALTDAIASDPSAAQALAEAIKAQREKGAE